MFKQIGEKPVSFHTTGNKFWDGSVKYTSGKSTSEIDAQYFSSQISETFARINGKGSGYKIFPSWKDLISPETSPAVLSSYGAKYRVVGVGKSTGKYPWEFNKPAKEGYFDIPKNFKTEIEALFREGAGELVFTGKKFKANIQGVDIPIDVYEMPSKSGSILDVSSKVLSSAGKKAGEKLGSGISSYGEPSKSYFGGYTSVFSNSKGSSSVLGRSYIKSSSPALTPSSSVFSRSYIYPKPSYPSYPSHRGSSTNILSYSEPSLKYSEPPSVSYPSIRSSIPPISSTNYFGSSVAYPKSSSGGSSYYYNNIFKEPVGALPKFGREKKNQMRSVDLYSLLYRRHGKQLQPVASGLTKSQALKLGSEKIMTNLLRQFKIQKTGSKEIMGFDEQDFKPSEKLFREYKISKGRKISTPNVFTQKTNALLQTNEEKRLIKQAQQFMKKKKGGRY